MVIFRSTLGLNVTSPAMPTTPVGGVVLFTGTTRGLTSECSAVITSGGQLSITRPRDVNSEKKRAIVSTEYYTLVKDLAFQVKPYLFNACIPPN